MLVALLDTPVFLAGAIIALALLSYRLGLWALRLDSSQPFFEHPGATAAEQRSSALQMARPFITAAPVAALAFLVDPITRQVLCGGYIVMQLGSVGLTIDALLHSRVLLIPGVAEGRLRLSDEYLYLTTASRSFAFAVLFGIVSILFWSLAFGAGSALLAATAIGWYRRARRARMSAPVLEDAPPRHRDTEN